MKDIMVTLGIIVTKLPMVTIITSVFVVAKVAVGFIVTILTKLPTSFLVAVATRTRWMCQHFLSHTLLSALTFHFSCAI